MIIIIPASTQSARMILQCLDVFTVPFLGRTDKILRNSSHVFEIASHHYKNEPIK